MDREINVSLEVYIVSDRLNTDTLTKKEIDISDSSLVVCVNRQPFYTGQIKEAEGMILCKISRILEKEESVNIKNKYLL
ncbi:hypothetical protein [Persephonella sp.]